MKDKCIEKVAVKSDDNETIKGELEEEIVSDAKNGDLLLISKDMLEEEEKLLEARAKEAEEEQRKESEMARNLNEAQFTKLDELLTQTQLFSQFLLEKMDDITLVWCLIPLLGDFFSCALQFYNI